MKEKKLPRVKIKSDGTHGRSLFADEEIKKGGKVIEYVGERVSKKEAERRIEEIDKKVAEGGKPGRYYIFELNKKWDIDGDVSYNSAKYINHSCEPNCETEIEDDRVWIVALKKIKGGEELTYDYAWEFDKDDYWQRPCHCGSKNCVGYILKDKEWIKLKRYLEKKGYDEEAKKVGRAIKARKK